MAEICGKCRFLDEDDVDFWGRCKCTKDGRRHYKSDDGCSKFNKLESKGDSFHRFGWYITTMICKILGYGEDNEVLTITKNLRPIMENDPRFQEFIKEYDAIGPVIANALANDPDAQRVALDLMSGFLIQCAILAKNQNYEDAILTYINMFTSLKIRYKSVLDALGYKETKVRKLVRVRVKKSESVE